MCTQFLDDLSITVLRTNAFLFTHTTMMCISRVSHKQLCYGMYSDNYFVYISLTEFYRDELVILNSGKCVNLFIILNDIHNYTVVVTTADTTGYVK